MTTPLTNLKQQYKPRIADQLLAEAMSDMAAIQVIGPKWCGKTTTAEQACRSAVYFQDPDQSAFLKLAAEKPSLLLAGEKPILLDEWQDAPQVWDAVRFAVDRDPHPGQFVLTGSTVVKPENRQLIKHSGTGRFARVRMRPMSLFESGDSNGAVSLAGLFDGPQIEAVNPLALENIASLIVRGGWPAAVNSERPGRQAKEYVDSITEADISRVDGVEKNPNRVRLLLRSLARNESTAAKMTVLREDIATEGGAVSVNTIAQYLEALRGLYVLEEQQPWAEAVRSKVAMRTAPVRRYCDPSIPAVILGLSEGKLLTDFNTFGLLFESLAVRDLRCYAEAADAQVFHYHDLRDLECDALVERRDGAWGAVEIKLGSTQTDAAKANLLTIQKKVTSQHRGPASFLLVVTNTPYAYRDSDGVYFVPLACLRP
jgi:predicted AAA+ superfamily ATPase